MTNGSGEAEVIDYSVIVAWLSRNMHLARISSSMIECIGRLR
jgi:hypothetical protein